MIQTTHNYVPGTGVLRIMPMTPADSAAMKAQADSLRGASVSEGIVITQPEPMKPELRATRPDGMSWVLAVLLALFCFLAIRTKNNGRYITALLQETTEVRERHNVFDDTVRETSFLILLNVLWCCCAGVVLYSAAVWFNPFNETYSMPVPSGSALCMALCAAITTAYTLLKAGAYITIGNVFADSRHAAMWLRGFSACQGLASILLLPVALLCICMPEWMPGLLIAAAVIFICSEFLFVGKGFRIFFSQISSWVLFLYYLCSLEIIPLILTYVAALYVCTSVA